MKTVLFVCAEKAGRSHMGEAIFNKCARDTIKAASDGTMHVRRVNPLVIEALKEIGIDLNGKKPESVTTEMIKEANRILTMGCEGAFCPANFLLETEDWKLEDPKGKPIEKFRELRNDIQRRI